MTPSQTPVLKLQQGSVLLCNPQRSFLMKKKDMRKIATEIVLQNYEEADI